MMQDTYNPDELLKGLAAQESIEAYVVFNNDGVPLKYFKKNPTGDKTKDQTQEKAVHQSALFQDLWNVASKVLKQEQRFQGENEVECMRLRTKHSFEYIVTQSGDFTIVVKQLCGKAIEEYRILLEEIAKIQAEAEDEKKKK
ncbi:hypothetical protein PPERSA_06721 [Pseudocohnilembus persalinus]|uniref:Roadblock/LAMTOR2 domain-containing protein n=1 Tax=Pseudocohnilembus persalinus TaxID=266149 RepID=A0A0V0QS11_PSEPJ|nr:hypothetical protein PPERSA_06721 [Pseudocohnilembus persalinus]|eukprot:KRX05087.1 hypothetical protein PPERSA_06721 [Pseudocohnilembus persalinus]